MARRIATRRTPQSEPHDALPAWIQPQLTELVKEPPGGTDWLHELKFDGYRMHARLDHGSVRLLTPHRARLDAKIPGNRRGTDDRAGVASLSRRRAVRRSHRRHDILLRFSLSLPIERAFLARVRANASETGDPRDRRSPQPVPRMEASAHCIWALGSRPVRS